MTDTNTKSGNSSMWKVLKRKDFRSVWFAQTLSAFGDPIFPFAMAFWALDNDKGASGVAMVFGARAVAVLVTVVIGGVLADRFPRKNMMVIADFVRFAALVAIILGPKEISAMYVAVLVFIVGMGESLFRPAVRALLPSLLDNDLQMGNALLSATNRVAGLLGPALAGVLVVAVGHRLTLVITAVTFLCSGLLLLSVREPKMEAPETRMSVVREAVEGFVEVLRHRWLAIEILTAMLQVGLSLAPWLVLLPIFAYANPRGEMVYSSLLIAMGIGAFLGALLAGKLPMRNAGVTASLALLPFSLSLAGLALDAPLPVLIGLHVATGIGTEIYIVLWTTAVQRDVPSSKLGRVFALDELGSRALLPLGMLAVGSLVGKYSIGTILLFAAAVNAVTAVGPLVLRDVRQFASPRRHRDESETELQKLSKG